MSSIDLNIVSRGIKGYSWTDESGQIKKGDLSKIVEQKTDSSTALNALPTPFARFFVADEAFRRAYDQLVDPRNPDKAAGKAYDQLVSDCLDVFELLYNLSSLKNKYNDILNIKIVEWDKESQLKHLKELIPKLGISLSDYYDNDLKGMKSLYFVVLITENENKDKIEFLLGTSSPYTGFVTPPDLDKYDIKENDKNRFIGPNYEKIPLLKRNENGYYFKDILPFSNRDKGFKIYMANLVDQPLPDSMKNLQTLIKRYVEDDNEIPKNPIPSIRPILSTESSEVDIMGLKISENIGPETLNIFSNTLIKLPYKLSGIHYKGFIHENEPEDRDYDYLIPLRPEALEGIKEKLSCRYRTTPNGLVTVTINYNGLNFEKKYSDTPLREMGNILDLKKNNLNLNIGIFPNIISTNDCENNYFKVAAILKDSSQNYHKLDIENIHLEFYSGDGNNLKIIDTIGYDEDIEFEYGVRPGAIRSRQNENDGVIASSKYYEIFQKDIRALNLEIELAGVKSNGVLIPSFNKAVHTNSSYTYAIDLGTTNTYISVSKTGEFLEPEQLRMQKPMVSYLHSYKSSGQYSLNKIILDGIFEGGKETMVTEFLPPLIDNRMYTFPIRTAMCKLSENKKSLNLFDNANIAFFYEKSLPIENQSIQTDIKWDRCGKELRLFIKELLLIIKSDVLQRNGILSETKLVWFRPLSFKGDDKARFERIWREEAKSVLNVSSDKITCVSESEAPYYYFKKQNIFTSVDSVAIVDIGGGSSDFIYFSDSKPLIANSIQFGCDVLWGNGHNEFENTKKNGNGIYQKYKDFVHFANDESLEEVNISMNKNQRTSTKDIINFWIGNDKKLDFLNKMKTDFKPLFLYHFTSIIYYMSKMYHAKGVDSPRSILFCGNGSKYIDSLISSEVSTIQKMVIYVFKRIFGEDIKDIQIILPEERKECTCYGGLFKDKTAATPEEFNYQGDSDGKAYQSIKEIIENYESSLRQQLLDNLKECNDIFFGLLDILSQNNELDLNVSRESLKKVITDNLEDYLDKNFKTQVIEKYDENEVYHDSLFFLPIIDNIYQLTLLKK